MSDGGLPLLVLHAVLRVLLADEGEDLFDREGPGLIFSVIVKCLITTGYKSSSCPLRSIDPLT